MELAIAAAPLVVAFVALAVLQRTGLQAGVATVAVAVGIALLAPSFHLAPDRLLAAVAEGVLTSFVVLYVLLPGLLLYHLQRAAGSLDVLARAIARLSADPALRVLLLVLGLSPFVESASGFGLGTVVVTPILLALGVAPARAAALGALSLVAVPWGALAVGTVLGAELTGLDAGVVGARTALLAAPLPAAYGLAALAIEGGRTAVSRHWPAALAAGATLTVGTWAFSRAPGVELAGVLASALSLALLAGWARRVGPTGGPHPTPREASSRPTPSPARGRGGDRGSVSFDGRAEVARAVAPYVVLTVLLLVSRLVAPLRDWLQANAVLAVSGLEPRLPLLYNPGFWVLLATVAAAAVSGLDRGALRAAMTRTWRQFLPGAVAIMCFLVAAQLMRVAGMTTSLGEAAATLGAGYAWVAPGLGALGGWLTGSNAGSNAMFARLHYEAAPRAGLAPEWVLGAQNAAASHATMVSPARTILAATAAGLPGGEGRLLRQIGPIVLAAVLSITLLLVMVT